MAELNKVSSRNNAIQEMLTNSNGLKNFYRFVSQNPHINLHDACQIVVERPNASVCFSFEEWKAMGRSLSKGSKGILYFDDDGVKHYVFDANDTYGTQRFHRNIFPLKCLLEGLDELNGTELKNSGRRDYQKILSGVARYLQDNDNFTDDEKRNRIIAEGIAYSLYSCTSVPKDNGIALTIYPYSLLDNAQLFAQIREETVRVREEIEDAYLRKQQQVVLVDDTEEDYISDEPIMKKARDIVEFNSASISQYKDYDVLYKDENGEAKIYLGKKENYDNKGNYDNTDNSLIFVSNNGNMFSLLQGGEYTISQYALEKENLFSEQDYKEYSEILDRFDGELEQVKTLKFSVSDKNPSGVPFRYPYYKGNEMYLRYMSVQDKYPDSIVLFRLGDFYEVLGEKAKVAAEQLELTLTGRDCGLDERVPMCGFPFHTQEKFTNKLLEQSSVVMLEHNQEPVYIPSKQEESIQPPIKEKHIELEELSPEESAELDEYFSPMLKEEEIVEPEYDEPIYEEEIVEEETSDFIEEPNEDEDFDEEDTDEDSEEDYEDGELEEPEEETVRDKNEKGLHERKRKNKTQGSLFDLLEPQTELNEQELLIERVLKRGSHVSGGKIRIYDKYQTNPTLNEFSRFLSKEYGIGGYSGPSSDSAMHDGKGIRGENWDKSVSFNLKWTEVATRIADLIDDGNYLTFEEKSEYARVVRFRKERAEADTEDKLKDVIAKQIVEYGTAKTYDEKFREYPHFLEDYIDFFTKNQEDIYQRLLKFDEVKEVYRSQEFLYRDVEVAFKLEYCPRWQARLERIARRTEKLKNYAKNFIIDGASNYLEENVEDNTVVCYVKDKYDKEEFLFLKDNREELVEILQSVDGVEQATFSMEKGFAIVLNKDYVEAINNGEKEVIIPDKKAEPIVTDISVRSLLDTEEKVENTNLEDIGFDQSELGGAKQRYKNNVDAIKLVNRLYREDRNPTDSEKSVLAKYVGWGGLPQAFDESNEKWQVEYKELKAILSQNEYDTAKGSILNAHFTAKEVIGGIYKALQKMGVRGNNKILEPALGTGNFFGFMPKDIAENAKLYGVEIDEITGKIATKLYPQANVQIKGFEQTSFPNDKFDLMVSNVPFGNYTVYDSEYSKQNFQIHDYFIAKGIDKIKPNGLMAVITSKGTLDKITPTVRKYIADRAELVGAIRLPNNAFKQTAGTEVTSDILFFQKREENINATADNTEWLSVGTSQEGFELNNYYIKHPEMVCGTLAKEHGMYGLIDLTVKPDGRTLEQAIADAVEHLPENIYENPEYVEETDKDKIEVDYDVKPLCYKAENGKLYMREGDEMVEQTIPSSPKDAYQRIVGMIGLRKCVRNILNLQLEGCSDQVLQINQWELESRYDTFVKKYGYLNSQTNSKLFKEDADSALLFSIENISEDKKSATKADIFTKRTIRPYTVPTHTDDCFEALQISRNEKGAVDIAYIEELTNKDFDTVITELGDSIYRNPVRVNPEDKCSGYETQDEYLSGEVVRKLAQAEYYVEKGNVEYERNVKALEQVQPEPLTASEISVKLGACWIDKRYYEQFLCEMLNIPSWVKSDIGINFNKYDGSWHVERTHYAKTYKNLSITQVFGTERANAFRLFEDCMNQKSTQIYDTIEESDGRTKRVLNHAETIAAREKQNKIQEAFKYWIYEVPERREDLENTYNNIFNQIRLPSYDGSHLKFPEMNPAIELRPHQKNAVQRITSTGQNTLLHHVVGSGKTMTMIASGMKLKQYGLAKKPMFVVPNHLVQQWGNEFRKLYPNANILITQKDDLDKDKRKRFVSKVAMGDWDGIIIAQSTFAKIGISTERQVAKLNEEIQSIEDTINNYYAEHENVRGTVKNLERIKKGREAQLKKLLDDSKKDNVLNFESLGVDYLFVDESDAYKNLFLYTKMNNVAGISNAASQRASDLQMKIEYINELHDGDKGVVFATGTPISNSMAEMYTLQTYLQKRKINDLGINFFDSWAANFGEAVMALELAPSGQGYRAKTRFAKFTNLPELLTLYRSFADVQTKDMVKLDVPEEERRVITIKPSDEVIELTEQIAERAERIYEGGVDPHIDNMLKITSDGKKIALDPRCYDPALKDDEISKLNECANAVYEYYTQSNDIKGTQLVFCDLATPKKTFEEYEYGKDFDAYNDLKYKLVQKGIPKEEIAFIHDANSDLQKQALFNKVNDGTVRVLIGSTEKCGAGTNVQKRLVALHHLDAPYRPRDLIQRDGRGIRQGNINEKVYINTYVRERTFDSYSYQILENKQRFISQIDRGDLTIREAEDIDEATLSYAEIKAITSANPKIKRKMELDTELQQLRILEGRYKKNLYDLQDKVRKTLPEQISRQELYLERVRQDVVTAHDKFDKENFSITIGNKTYTDRKEGAKALYDMILIAKTGDVIAEYSGFKISLDPIILMTAERTLTISGAGNYQVGISQTGNGTLNRIDDLLENLADKESNAFYKLERLKGDLETAKAGLEIPFEHTAKIEELSKELVEINAELDLNKREEIVIDDGEENDGEVYMGLPEENEEIVSVRQKARTKLSKAIEELYVSEQEKSPDAYVFIYDKGNYCVLGDKAEQVAEMSGAEIHSGVINGKEGKWLSLTEDEFGKVVNTLTEDKVTVKVAMPTKKQMEETFIDKSDLLEEMQVDILPEYRITQDDMHIHGYHWNGMLPMGKVKAKTLFEFGLPIYFLTDNDMEIQMTSVEEIEKNSGFYGIEKDAWNDFITNKDTYPYIVARAQVLNAMLNAMDNNTDMGYIDKKYLEPIKSAYFEEAKGFNDYAQKNGLGDIEKAKQYIPQLIDETTGKFVWVPLEEFGIDLIDVRTAIIDNIENEELKKFAIEYCERLNQEEIEKLDNKVDKELDQELESMSMDEAEELLDVKPVNHREEVIVAVNQEIEDYRAELTKKPIEEILNDNYYIYLKHNFAEIIMNIPLPDEVYKKLYEDRGNILETLSEHYSNIDEFNDHNNNDFMEALLDATGYDESEKSISAQDVLAVKEEPQEYEINDDSDYSRAVIDSVEKEFDEFRTEMLNSPQINVFHNNYKIHAFTEYLGIIQMAEYLEEDDYKILYEDRGHILESLYNDCLNYSNFNFDDFSVISNQIKSYCDMRFNVICKEDIEKAITENYDGMHLKEGFEDGLIDKYGLEQIKFVLANTVQENDSDDRFSLKNKEWASKVEVSLLPAESVQLVINTHPAVLDGFINRIRKKEKELTEVKNEMSENQELIFNNGTYTVKVPYEAMVNLGERYSILQMPSNGKYAGYTFTVSDNNIEPARKKNLETEELERCLNIYIKEGQTKNLRKGEEEISISSEEFAKVLHNTKPEDYPKKTSEWVTTSLPNDAMRGMYENATLFSMPTNGDYNGYSYYIPNAFVFEDMDSEDERIVLSIPSDMEIKLNNRETKERVVITAERLKELTQDTVNKDYYHKKENEDKPKEIKEEPKDDKKTGWQYVSVSQEARLGKYEKASLFKMPNGEYENYMYYLPNAFLKDNEEKQTVRVGLPEDFNVTIKDMANEDEITFTAREFVGLVRDKDKDSYKQENKKFIAPKREGKFNDSAEKLLRESVPNVMKDKPNWIAVSTRYDESKDKVKKYLINPNNSEYAESDNPKTWASFDKACKFAKENNCDAVAFALDGKDGIACIDLDKCKNENGEYTEFAKEVMSKCGKTYMETSVSGKGLHVFGTTQGMDVRTFSKDGEMEFYQNTHFITMTGEGAGYNWLENFDKPDMKNLIESKCEKRAEWRGVGLGVEGLSYMTDREVTEKAMKGPNGDKFTKLYNGEDIFNDHSRSDMSLMSRLVYWCNGDKEQMLRIFATSGLYRKDKSPSYYECTAIKAIRGNSGRISQLANKPKPTVKKTGNSNGGKR